MSLTILVLPGDGIGPEITAATLRVVKHLDTRLSLGIELVQQPIGLASLRSHGTTLRDETLEAARTAAGVILGPVSSYEYPPAERGGINPSAAIRRSLDLYANIRPARAFEGVRSTAADMDLVVVRENTEGFYADRSMHMGIGEFMPTPDLALAVRKITRSGSERIARTAFELAMRRRREVTVVHKANVLRISDGLFLEAVRDVAKEFPEVSLRERLIDAMTALLVRTPADFDVIVTSNMYGDILSDEATELAGGIGLGGAINAGTDHAIAQATHGSAPDIAGQGAANPAALMLSTAMLLGWLGARHASAPLEDASRRLEEAVARALADAANHTPDLGGKATTEGFADAVVAALA